VPLPAWREIASASWLSVRADGGFANHNETYYVKRER
jgi:hypothetical protein